MHRKIVAILLAVIAFALMSSCGKSEAAQSADALIMEIGIVTKGSEQKIVTAEDAVNGLTEREKKQLDNLTVLAGAREQYDQLLVQDVVTAIDQIGTVTLSSGDAISNARKCYDGLAPELQPKVGNYSDLVNAEVALPNLMIAEVEESISAIGRVTISSEYKISKAREKYDGLDSSLQPSVKNYDVLLSAEEALFQLKVESVEKAIRSVGTVTRNSGSQLSAARKKYDSADDAVKAAVSNYDVLVSAEDTYKTLRAEYVMGLITEIGTVTLDSESKINFAKSEYNKLTSEERTRVTNYGILTSAQGQLQSLKKAQAEKEYKNSVARMRTETDKVEGITWHHSDEQPEYIDERCYLFPYIGERGTFVWLRLKFNYTGNDWIFYEEITIWIDGKRYYPDFDYDDVRRDNDSGDVWEVLDISPSSDDIEMLWEIINSKETIIRFDGDDGRRDFTISAADKRGIKDVLIVYEYMKAH